MLERTLGFAASIYTVPVSDACVAEYDVGICGRGLATHRPQPHARS